MMTNGPHAKIGKIETIDLPRPRTRKALLAHPDYYKYRESLLTFLPNVSIRIRHRRKCGAALAANIRLKRSTKNTF